jgi:site-specific DNA recombinase
MPAYASVIPDHDVSDVVIYARYSSASQNEQSIDGQIDACTRYADQHGFRVIESYIDRALSGTHADSRPDFQRMIKDSRKHAFKYVLVWKLDRFARNRYDSAIYKNELKKSGVRVLSVTEGIGEGSDSIILEAVLEAMAEEYSRQLSQNIRRGMRQNAEKTLSLGGRISYGYRIEDKHYMINEQEAQLVRYVFSRYASGIPKTDILQDCESRGWRVRSGKPLSFNGLSKMLLNPLYIGVYRFKGETISDSAVPPIIDRETFDKVQQLISRNRRAPARSKAKEEYQLQGKLFCGYCGSPMVGDGGRGRHGKIYHYYTCSAQKKHHTCQKKREHKDFLEWYVVEQVEKSVLTESRIRDIAAGVAAEYAREFDASGIKDLEKKIRDFDKQTNDLVDALVRTTAPSAVKLINERIDLLSVQKEDAEIDLAKLKVASRVSLTESDVVSWLRQFTRGDPTDPSFRQRVIDIFVNSVYLYDDKLVMYFNIKDCTQVSFIEMQDDVSSLPDFPVSDLNSFAPP